MKRTARWVVGKVGIGVGAVVIVSIIFLLSGCGFFDSSQTANPTGTGTLRISIHWPETRIIPAETAYIKITVSGVGLAQPIEKIVEPPSDGGEVTVVTLTVPAGEKMIRIIAYDKQDAPLAAGSTSVIVGANTTTQAVIELGEIKGAYFPLKVGNEWSYDVTIQNTLGILPDDVKKLLPDYVPYPYEAKGKSLWRVSSLEESLFSAPVYAMDVSFELPTYYPIIEEPPVPPKILPRSPLCKLYLTGGTTENLLLWGVRHTCPQYYDNHLTDFVPPLLILDLSLPPYWEVGKVGVMTLTAESKGEEKVETPIGTFSCIKVTYTSMPISVEVVQPPNGNVPAQANIITDVWYSEELGVVKMTITISPEVYIAIYPPPLWQCSFLLNGTNVVEGNLDIIVK